MKIFLFIMILILAGLLILSRQRHSAVVSEKDDLIRIREVTLEIAGRVAGTRDPAEIYQYILDSCLTLLPKAKFGYVLMSDEDNLLSVRAFAGFSRSEIIGLKLKPEESFHYIATGGKMDRTVIINNLEVLAPHKNSINANHPSWTIRSEISTPLRIDGEPAGILCINGDQTGIFAEKDLYILDYMASQIGIVLQNQKLCSKIMYLSRYDSLTDLLNRETFEKETEKLIKDPSKDAASLFFVLMDLDELKTANALNGHYFGNDVLKAFSEVIKKRLGKNDLCGRYGGDEFAAIIQGDKMNIDHVLEDAKKELSETKIGLLTNEFIPKFSYGMASFRESNNNLDALYKLASDRMYDTKKEKKILTVTNTTYDRPHSE